MPDFDRLLEKYLSNELKETELETFMASALLPENAEKLRRAIERSLHNRTPVSFAGKEKLEQMFEQVMAKTGDTPPHTRRNKLPKTIPLIVRIAAAACLLLIVGIGAYKWRHSSIQKVEAPSLSLATEEVIPGGDKATLTLADGTVIDLNTVENGTLAKQDNILLKKNENGEIVYQREEETATPASGNRYNTMRTPRGGQYKLVLPDGTRVWLNASSSIKYPVLFDKVRSVEMNGEAYFEVAHQPDRPFVVQTNDVTVHVTGTHFNVSAYDEEPAVSTTLLEGSVIVESGGVAKTLKPGQQISKDHQGNIRINTVDVESAVAWKNGLFSFDGEEISVIMRQLSRWYDIEVYHEGKVPRRLFSGKVFRNLHLSETLKVLELSNVRFRLEGRKLTVIH